MAGTHPDVSLIGRRLHLDRLRGLVGELSTGHGRAALVEGEPGIGKSSLVRAAITGARSGGKQVFWCVCDELSQAFPLLPFLDALAASDQASSTGHTQVTELLRADPAPGTLVDPVAAAAGRLLELVEELCAESPVIFVVDDLQWADPATVLMFGRLTRSVSHLPLLVLGTARPVPQREDLVALRRLVEHDDLLRLDSLTADEVADLIEAAVKGPPGPRLLRLAAGAAGNPLYLTELIDALVRGGALVVEDGRVEVTNGRAPASLPAAIADRLEFLSTSVRGVLRAAALLGVEFSVSELAAVSGRRVTDLLPVLDEAIVAGVLRAGGPELAFRHPLIRAALYEEMPAAVRAAWHRDAARALAADGAAAEQVARQLLPALAVHDGGASADDWAVRWLAETGQQLVGQAPYVAAPLLRWAVNGTMPGVAPHDLLVCRLADALYRAGDASGAAKVATGALEHVARPDLVVDLHCTLMKCRAIEGRSAESIVALRRALDSPSLQPRHRAWLLVHTARAHRSLGQVDLAGQVATEALTVATAAEDRWATGWALGVLALVHGMSGDEIQALSLFERALAVAEGDPGLVDLRSMLQINQAAALGDLDRYDAAIRVAQQARQFADHLGNVVRLAQAQSVLGELLFDVGRWDEALAEVDSEPDRTKEPFVQCTDHGVAATIRLHRGIATAARDLAEAEPYAARLGRTIGSLTLARSLYREQAEEPAEALGVLMEGLCGQEGELEQTTDLLADAVRLAVNVGEKEIARGIVERAEAVAHESVVPHRQAVALHCRGLLDHDPEMLLGAADRYRDAGRPLPRAQAMEAAGVALADSGDISGARAQFTGAFSVYSALGAGWDLARTQATFRAYGIRRGPHVPHRRSAQGWSSLTPAELKVVALVARGMSNPQIAAHLFLSRRTVQTHVSHILTKLDLHSRTDIAREASRRSA